MIDFFKSNNRPKYIKAHLVMGNKNFPIQKEFEKKSHRRIQWLQFGGLTLYFAILS